MESLKAAQWEAGRSEPSEDLRVPCLHLGARGWEVLRGAKEHGSGPAQHCP